MGYDIITAKTKAVNSQTILSFIILGLVVLGFIIYLYFELNIFLKEMDKLDENNYYRQIQVQEYKNT
ncbi:MAG: hypothetical protein ABH837_00785 [bacterium]